MLSFLFSMAGLLNLLFYVFAIGFVISLILEQYLKVRPLSVDASINERNDSENFSSMDSIVSVKDRSTVIERKPEIARKISPRYKVLLHNDPVNTMEYVVKTLRLVVPKLTEQDAIAVMLEAHNTGIGLVIICDLEPAEFYSETLNSKGLTSTIEKEN